MGIVADARKAFWRYSKKFKGKEFQQYAGLTRNLKNAGKDTEYGFRSRLLGNAK